MKNKDIPSEKEHINEYICKCWYEISGSKKFYYGMPAYTGPF
jgi:hypothetical protein